MQDQPEKVEFFLDSLICSRDHLSSPLVLVGPEANVVDKLPWLEKLELVKLFLLKGCFGLAVFVYVVLHRRLG